MSPKKSPPSIGDKQVQEKRSQEFRGFPDIEVLAPLAFRWRRTSPRLQFAGWNDFPPLQIDKNLLQFPLHCPDRQKGRPFPPVIKAILFDFDGLILDTETPIFTAWQQVYAEYACSLAMAEYAGCVGGTHLQFDPLADLEKKCGTPLVAAEIHPRVSKIFTDLIARNDALPGIRETLVAAKKRGIPAALASNSTRKWVTGHLERLELLPYFTVIRTRDDVDLERLKPEPDLFLSALEGLGVEAEHAIVFEDSPHGILAARRAGIFSVAIPNAITTSLHLNDPDLRLSSLTDMPLEALLEQIQQQKEKRSPRT